MVSSNIPTKARKIPQELDLLREPCIRSPRSEPPPGKPLARQAVVDVIGRNAKRCSRHLPGLFLA